MSEKNVSAKPKTEAARPILEIKLSAPLPSGGDWFSTERSLWSVARDGDVGFFIADTRGQQWWVPMSSVSYVVYVPAPVAAAAE